MRFKITLKDARPTIGIFEIIDNALFADVEEPDLNSAVAGVVDGGHLFHRDLVRAYKDDPAISYETKQFIKENIDNPNLHMCFPRGRICYNVNTDEYEVYSNEDVLRDTNIMTKLLRFCNIPFNKVKLYVDYQHYSLLPREELR